MDLYYFWWKMIVWVIVNLIGRLDMAGSFHFQFRNCCL